jgi:hypothetical protein
MFAFEFKNWLVLSESSASVEAQQRFASLNNDYILPFAEALLAHSKKNKKFLNSDQKKEIKSYIDNENEEQTPYGIAGNSGDPAIYRIGRMVLPLYSSEFAGGMVGHTERKTLGIGSGFLARTFNIIVKDPAGDYIFKNFPTFTDYLDWVAGRSWMKGAYVARSAYPVNSFNSFIYYLIATRLQSAITKAADKLRSNKELSTTDDEGGEMEIGGTLSHDAPYIAVSRDIQVCLGEFFTKAANTYLQNVQKHFASLNNANFDDIKARYSTWHYLICEYMKENFDKMGYDNIRNLYEKYLELETKGGGRGNLYRSMLMSFKNYSDLNLKNFIVEKLKNDAVVGKVGLLSTARRIYEQAAPCGVPLATQMQVIKGLPKIHGINDWFVKNKDSMLCRRRPVPASYDLPVTGAEQQKIDYLIDTFLDSTFPTRDTHWSNFRAFNANLAYNLEACIKVDRAKAIRKKFSTDDTSEEEEFKAGGK